MIKRNLFQKKSLSLINYLQILFLVVLLILCLTLLFVNLNKEYFDVPEFIESFYIIPDNKGGIKVLNLNKKSLHLNDNKNSDIQIINDSMLEYSIQIFTSNNYSLVKNKFDYMTNQNNNYIQNLSLNINDLFIVVFNNDLNNEYMLLYKNFSTRVLALNYCIKHLNFLQKCLIVNVQNLN